jgi:hypothetical protein
VVHVDIEGLHLGRSSEWNVPLGARGGTLPTTTRPLWGKKLHLGSVVNHTCHNSNASYPDYYIGSQMRYEMAFDVISFVN